MNKDIEKKFCENCGETLSSNSKFCTKCGNSTPQVKNPEPKKTSNNNTSSNVINSPNNKYAIVGIIVFIIFFIFQLVGASAYYVTHGTFNIIFWGFTFVMIMLVLIYVKIK